MLFRHVSGRPLRLGGSPERKSYQAWRDQLTEMQDEVVEETGRYRIRTRAGSGELTLATLTIRVRDLQSGGRTIRIQRSGMGRDRGAGGTARAG